MEEEIIWDLTWEELEEQREANEQKEAEKNAKPKTRKYV